MTLYVFLSNSLPEKFVNTKENSPQVFRDVTPHQFSTIKGLRVHEQMTEQRAPGVPYWGSVLRQNRTLQTRETHWASQPGAAATEDSDEESWVGG